MQVEKYTYSTTTTAFAENNERRTRFGAQFDIRAIEDGWRSVEVK